MKLSGILTRRETDLAGTTGTARVQRRRKGVRHLVRRVKPGEIAVLDQLDLDARVAEALVEAGAVGVVDLAPSMSGRFPNRGPEILLAAGVALVDGVAEPLLDEVRDGARLRLHEGGIFVGDREIGRGEQQDADSVADQLVEAQAGMSAQLEAFGAEAVEFLRKDRTLILDGIGVPELTTPVTDRHVLVVSGSEGGSAGRDELRRLKKYVADQRPVLIGVEDGADLLRGAGHRPDVVVADPERLDPETLRCAGEIVLPADLDGHAPGSGRIRELGLDAVTFPSAASPEDLALLLADTHEAELVVVVGFRASLRDFLDRGRPASNPSTLLTRLRLGDKLVGSRAVAALRHRRRNPLGAIVSLLLVLALAGAAFALWANGGPMPVLDSGAALVADFRQLFG